MVKIDEQEEKIIRELIKDTRISDNQISKSTRVPVMTVNRKRKKLEQRGLIRYFTSLNTGEGGTGRFPAKELYIIKLRIGLTQNMFLTKLEKDNRVKAFHAEHIEFSFLGEKDGHLAIVMIVTAKTESALMEIFNGRLIPFFKENFGEDAVKEVITTNISKPIRLHHNYLPWGNIENARIKEDWSDDWIFVDKPLEKAEAGQKKISQFK